MSKKINISLPKSWNELSDWQLQNICALLYSEISGTEFDLLAFKILVLGEQPSAKLKSDLFTVLYEVPMRYLKEDFDFIYKPNTRTVFPKNVHPEDMAVFPPFDRISNLSASEFAVADDLHIKFRETKNIEYLYYLAATLYVSEHQPRPDFDKNNLEILVPKFRTLPIEQLYAIELSYSGCKDHIVSKFKKAFPKSTKKTAKKYGFGKVILEMAGKKFGTHSETMKTNIYTFFTEFEENLNQKPKK